jgi:hypothetical protein
MHVSVCDVAMGLPSGATIRRMSMTWQCCAQARRGGTGLAYDAMMRIAPWGLAAVGDDPTRELAYRLDNVFNQRSAPKDPAAPADQPTS